MKTVINKIENENSALCIEETVKEASLIIKNGGLVAFPTETVYGLGASAFNPSAVKKIYLAKGRPSDNPLIVHISDLEMLYTIVQSVPEKARLLADAFWPGPLTMVFLKNDCIPYETSGGLHTVAVRFPINKIARLLIETAAVPVAAPSANISGRPSPTRGSHVVFDLDGKVDMIIDGGPCVYGLESTIVDVTAEIPILLRPGSITQEQIEKEIGGIAYAGGMNENEAPRAPGMKYTHYSPKAKVVIISGKLDHTVDKIKQLANKSNRKVGILATEQTKNLYDNERFLVLVAGDRQKPDTIAANLFKMLRKFDYSQIDEVYSESFHESALGASIMNRLEKAAGNNIIYV